MRSIGNRQSCFLGGVAFAAALAGCNSFDEPPGPDALEPRLVIPVDERPAVASPITPKPVSGGTLTVAADGSAAVVADPERDLVSIVDLQTLTVRATVTLQPGDEPGRSVEDSGRRVHVALRGAGAVATIDLASGSVVERRSVCRAPRGVAYDALTALVHVACAEGALVSLPAAGGAAVRSLALEPDLRDVLVRGDELWVTRFKSAEVLRVAVTGAVAGRVAIPQGSGVLTQPPPAADQFAGPTQRSVTVQSRVAWRAAPTSAGGAVIVHQQAVVDEIEITKPSSQGSSYGGGGFDCSGIVKNVVSTVAPDGSVLSARFIGAPLPVDVAVSENQAWVAVAHAGPADFGAPRPFLIFPSEDGSSGGIAGSSPGGFGGGSSVSLLPIDAMGTHSECTFAEGIAFSEPVTAVAFAPDGRLLAQTREPSRLAVVDGVPWGSPSFVALPGDSRLDTGHDLFHRDSGGGIACASCHPEGGEDGQTWRFAGFGERRTQALHVGLRGTAPFHWAGDLESVGALMTDVFVGRMGGVRQSSPRLDTLTEWLFSVPRPPALRDATDAAAVRGKQLFDSAAVGCATCHSGEKLTNNQSVEIDSVARHKLQVPSLVAVGYRAPFMHDGCADSLIDRFDPACGGDSHGDVSSLDQAQLNDLVAYLESL